MKSCQAESQLVLGRRWELGRSFQERVPHDIQVIIIKAVGDPCYDIEDILEVQRNLIPCTLVCRWWLPYARRQLFSLPTIRRSQFFKFLRSLRMNPILSSFFSAIIVVGEGNTSISSLFSMRLFRKLRSLHIHYLNLEMEYLFTLSPSSYYLASVCRLTLVDLKICDLLSLARFLCAFRQISELAISFHRRDGLDPESLSLGRYDRPFRAPRNFKHHSLRLLKIELIPGMDQILNLFEIRSLEQLQLSIYNNEGDRVQSLLDSCGDTLREVSFYLGTKSWRLTQVQFSRLVNLQEVTYGSNGSNVFIPSDVIGSLDTLPEINNVANIVLHNDSSLRNESLDSWHQLDDLLTKQKFNVVRDVEVVDFGPGHLCHYYFPRTFERGKLIWKAPLESTRSSWRLARELCELIIDCVAANRRYEPVVWQTALNTCCLVCHVWLHRARCKLSEVVTLDSFNLATFEAFYKCIPPSWVRDISINLKGPIASIVPVSRFPGLSPETLCMRNWDCTRQHPLLLRVNRSMHSVRHLKLQQIEFCNPANLVRLIGSFSSFQTLFVDFNFLEMACFSRKTYRSFHHDSSSRHHKRDCIRPFFPHPPPSLESLVVQVIPGASSVIHWLCRSEHLTRLTFKWKSIKGESTPSPDQTFRDIRTGILLCQQSLKELTLDFGNNPSGLQDPLVLDSLVQLRKLVYIGEETVLKGALKVLGAVDEYSRIRSISLLISGDSEADDWEQLDHILTDDKFKSLENVSTYNIHTSFLDELHSRGITRSIEPDEKRSTGIVRINSWRKEMRDEQESSKDREGDSNEWFYDPDSEMVDTEVS